jgi:hypothetical protein
MISLINDGSYAICDNCREKHNRVARIVACEGAVWLCRGCLEQALKLLEEADAVG